MSALCAGKWDLFDSRDIADHDQARKICAACPILAACREALAEAQRDAYSVRYGPRGTWAGRLLGGAPVRDQRRETTEEAMFTEADARVAHAAWAKGDRSDRARIGERVYQRLAKRRQAARREAVAA